MFQVLVIKSLKIVPIFIYLFFKMIDFDVKMTDRIFLTNTPSNHKNLHQLVINTFLFLFFQTADVKQRRRAGLLCSDVYFNAGISSGQHSLHACGLFFFFFSACRNPLRWLQSGSGYLPLCSRAARPPEHWPAGDNISKGVVIARTLYYNH